MGQSFWFLHTGKDELRAEQEFPVITLLSLKVQRLPLIRLVLVLLLPRLDVLSIVDFVFLRVSGSICFLRLWGTVLPSDSGLGLTLVGG